jgi:hypothetical protein
LETLYSDLAAQLPTQTDGNHSITLSADNLPLPPREMAIDSLYILKVIHVYNDWFKVDQCQFFAHKETYRDLGLLILSAVFHGIAEIKIKLNHPHTQLQYLTVNYAEQHIDRLTAGYHTQPWALEYYPQLPAKHPFDSCTSPQNLPCFEIANSQSLYYTEEHWQQRDTLNIGGSDAGLVLFAELLLNLSLPHNEQDEFELESESGFRGVGIGSAEARLFLPGHLAWTEEHWPGKSEIMN